MAARTAYGIGFGLLAIGSAIVVGARWTSSAGSPQSNALASCAVEAGDPGHAGMVFVPAASFTMGAEYTYPEEGPVHPVEVAGFWMDQTEVTNAQFREFAVATGYVTLAERGISNPADAGKPAVPGSAIFKPSYTDGQPDPFLPWWTFQQGASWQQPEGPGSDLTGRDQHPVVHVAFEDALAYADWKGHSLPTEEQFEFAAKTSSREDRNGKQVANTWQGLFPFQHDSSDGYAGIAPVGCYAANALGLYDLIGNVWEWTASPYYPSHDFAAKAQKPEGFDPNQPDEAVAVIKGGSYLCAPNYCMRYRPEARQGQSKGLGTSHIGFRTVLNR
jgi:sulfatase modifying factor 1